MEEMWIRIQGLYRISALGNNLGSAKFRGLGCRILVQDLGLGFGFRVRI